MKTISLFVSFLVLASVSCVPIRYGPVNNSRPQVYQNNSRRHLDSVNVAKASFEARIDVNHANRRQEVCEFAAAHFEQTGHVPTDEEVSRHFGFECHVRLEDRIKTIKIRPDGAPENIRNKFL